MRKSCFSKVAVITVIAAGLAIVPAAAQASDAPAASTPTVAPPLIVGPMASHTTSAPTGADCLAAFGIACYRPADLQAQYHFGPLYAAGDNGKGQTIVIFDAYGSPTIRQDLATFDSAFGLPAPPSFTIYMPEGNVNYNYTGLPSPVNFHNKVVGNRIGWAYETTLDVDWTHAMAPGANIDLVIAPVPQNSPLQNAQKFALSNNLGTIWSNSWSSAELAYHQDATIQNEDKVYSQAAGQGITAFFATGDSGATDYDQQGNLFPSATVTYPPSSLNAVAVGGTQVTTPTASISSYQPESVWNDGYGAGGGGYSTVFAEPPDQSAAGIPDPSGMRGVPDVSMNAAVISAALIYESFDPTVGPGWFSEAGTSLATPLWAGTDAVMNQADGPLGFLMPRLYQIYKNPALYTEAFHDITVGDNSFAGVTGYPAAPGWDAATGLGTPDAAGLADALSHTTPAP